VRVICEGLKCNDEPTADTGIERLFHFTTPMGRVAIAPPPPRSGLQGGVTLEYWLENAASSALGALTFCTGYELLGDARITPGSVARGALATQLIEVYNDPLEDGSDPEAALEAVLRGDDAYLDAILQANRDGTALPPPPVKARLRRRFWVSLEQQRRPPQQGCWLVKEFLPLKKSEFQRLNEGGEEFEGDDSG